jgi:sphingosine kinase
MEVMKFKLCPIQLSFKLEEDNKEKMATAWQSRKEGRNLTIPPSSKSKGAVDALPSLKYLQGEEDGWTIFNESILYVYAGKGPYVGR